MRHARADYNRIQDPDGLIPADEPVFLLRGQDALAARAVKFYSDLALQAGADKTFVAAAARQAEAMAVWPYHKQPDLTADDAGNVSRETLVAAYAANQAMLAGVVMDFLGYVNSTGAEKFATDILVNDSGDGDPVQLETAHALLAAFQDWGKARGIDTGHVSQDWRQKLLPAFPAQALDQ